MLITCVQGNAADALVGTVLCVGVIGQHFLQLYKCMLTPLGMQHSGIGGGGFMLVRDSKGNYESIGKSLISCPGIHMLTCNQTSEK